MAQQVGQGTRAPRSKIVSAPAHVGHRLVLTVIATLRRHGVLLNVFLHSHSRLEEAAFFEEDGVALFLVGGMRLTMAQFGRRRS